MANPNMFIADCGYNPIYQMDVHEAKKQAFVETTVAKLTAATGWDVSEGTNFLLDEPASAPSIASIQNMIEGMVYKLVVINGASAQYAVTFPSGTLYDGTITAANGMKVVYEFFTDGERIFCRRAKFA